MTRWVMRLVIANIVMFVLTSASPQALEGLTLVPVLILSRPWTLVTYMFLHGGVSHLLFNMLGLFFFGPRLELELGERQFLWLYFISGIMGGLLSFVFSPYTPIIGASGAIYGIMLGFAYYWPRAPIYIWGIFPVQARWLVVGMTALTLYGGFGGSGDGIAHFAHLGGFLGGFLYLKLLGRPSGDRPVQQKVSVPSVSKTDLERWMNIRREGMHEVNREELDRIMQKMNSVGPESLTMNEREFLDRFSTVSAH